jgi:hypothetical protein
MLTRSGFGSMVAFWGWQSDGFVVDCRGAARLAVTGGEMGIAADGGRRVLNPKVRVDGVLLCGRGISDETGSCGVGGGG